MKIAITMLFISAATSASMNGFKLGIENLRLNDFKTTLKKNPSLLRIGLITNQTGKTQTGERSVDFLRAKGLNITTLLTAEHGLEGTVLAGKTVHNGIDQKTGIPIISLYQNENGKRIHKNAFCNIDLLIFDMQDVGMRHYTYISTLHRVLEAAALQKKPVILCDRPNPLGGIMEGPLVEKKLHSFISIAPIPLRHGMTIGELALFFNQKLLSCKAELYIVPMTNYNRQAYPTKNLLAPLSPNIASLGAVHGYSFLGLLGEIKPFDVGIGTDYAFQQIGLPEGFASKACWQEARNTLLAQGINCHFRNYQRTTNNKAYEALFLEIKNIEEVSAFSLFLELISIFKKHKVELTFSSSFDKAIGVSCIREDFETKNIKKQTYALIKKNINHFYTHADNCFLYHPHPIIKMSVLKKLPAIEHISDSYPKKYA